MSRESMLAILRISFAVLGLTAVGVQLANGLQRADFSIANFFSFFTIESSLLAAVLLLIAAYGSWTGQRSRAFALLRGAATLYMTITGIVYILLLSGLEASLQMTLPWVNVVLHYILPSVVLIDWLVNRSFFRLSFRSSLVWLVFPVLYLGYSLVRGHMVDWYPYPFLNPGEGGYVRVGMTCAVIALSMIAITWLLSGVTRWRSDA